MKLKRTFRTIQSPEPKAIFIACGDPRFQDAIDEFRIEVLGLKNGNFVPIRNGGGPTPLAHPMAMPSRCKGMIRQIKFFCDKFPSIDQVILVTHGNCGYYVTAPNQCHGHGKERRDLPLTGGFVKKAIPRLRIELYYAELINGDSEITFEEVQMSEDVIAPPTEWTRQYETVKA